MILWPITLTWYCTSGLSLFVVLLLHKKAIAIRNTTTFISALCAIIGTCITGSSIGIYTGRVTIILIMLFIATASYFIEYRIFFIPKIFHFYKKTALYTLLLFIFTIFSGASHSYKTSLIHEYIKSNNYGLEADVIDISPWSKKNGVIITMQLKKHNKTFLSGYIKWYHKGVTNIKAGDTILIEKYHYKKASKEFELYQKKELIITHLFDRPKPVISVVNRPHFSLRRFFNDWRKSTYEKAKEKLSPLSFAFFSALFLGHKEYPEYEQIKEGFSHWGISHFLARSGIHIAILISIWSMLFRMLPLEWQIQQFLLILLLCFYALMSWPSLSFYRAFFLFLLYTLGLLIKRIPQPLYLLSLLTCATVIYNPYVASFLDFQLSFGVTFLLLSLSLYRKKRTIASN